MSKKNRLSTRKNSHSNLLEREFKLTAVHTYTSDLCVRCSHGVSVQVRKLTS